MRPWVSVVPSFAIAAASAESRSSDERADALVHKCLTDLDLGEHPCEGEARGLELHNGLSKDGASRGVGDRFGQRCTRRRLGGDRDREPLLREVRHVVTEPVSWLAENVRVRHVDILEEQFRRVLTVRGPQACRTSCRVRSRACRAPAP